MLKVRRGVSILLALVMVVALASPAWAQDAYTAQIEGRAAGEQHRTAAGVWSFAWGFLFGLVGAGSSIGYYAVSTPQPDDFTLLELSDRSSEYRLTYLRAYEDAAKKKQVLHSAVGGGLGVLGALALETWVYSSSYDSDYYYYTTDSVDVPAMTFTW